MKLNEKACYIITVMVCWFSFSFFLTHFRLFSIKWLPISSVVKFIMMDFCQFSEDVQHSREFGNMLVGLQNSFGMQFSEKYVKPSVILDVSFGLWM